MSTLPIYRVRARNIATDSENRIHDDEVARQYGFAGGLVPGIVVYGYLVRPVVESLGTDWLGRGRCEARFLLPCYEGEEVVVRAKRVEAAPGESEGFELVAERPDGRVCARGRAALPDAAAAPPDAGEFSTAPPTRPRSAATAETLRARTDLGALTVEPGEPALAGFAERIGDDLALYRGPDAPLHPGALLGLANEILARTVKLGPWIHAGSEVVHHSLARSGDPLDVRGRVVDRFDRKGHEMAVLDVVVIAGDGRVAQRIRHTAIYRPRPRG